jgi:hypothetical protein
MLLGEEREASDSRYRCCWMLRSKGKMLLRVKAVGTDAAIGADTDVGKESAG